MGNEPAKPGGKNDNSEILAELCMFERWADAKELLKTPTDLDRIYEGRTALHWAVFRSNFPTVRLLHRAGADLSIKNEDGKTAAEEAAECGTHDQKQIGQFLSRQARPKNAPPVSPRSPRTPRTPKTPQRTRERHSTSGRSNLDDGGEVGHYYLEVSEHKQDKTARLGEVLSGTHIGQLLVFCAQRRDLAQIKDLALAAGWSAEHCHVLSNLDSDTKRKNVMQKLDSCILSNTPCLVVALDLIESDMSWLHALVPLVVNYALPRAAYLWVDYAARAQKGKCCLSFVHHREVTNTVEDLHAHLNIKPKLVTVTALNDKLNDSWSSPRSPQHGSAESPPPPGAGLAGLACLSC